MNHFDYFVTFPSDHTYRRHFVLIKASNTDAALAGFIKAHGPTPVIVFTQEAFYSNRDRWNLIHLSTIIEVEDGSFEAEIKDRIFTAPPAEARQHG